MWGVLGLVLPMYGPEPGEVPPACNAVTGTSWVGVGEGKGREPLRNICFHFSTTNFDEMSQLIFLFSLVRTTEIHANVSSATNR